MAQKRAVLERYESVRAALAKDAIEASTRGAKQLEKAARVVAEQAGEGEAQWGAVADAAKALGELGSDDAEAVRRAFGEVNRKFLPLLRSDAALGKGLHVFKCPMASGYNKWVQPHAKLENPYMGTRMLECGSEVSL